MNRTASLVVLAALIVVIGWMTYEVFASFLLPLFLAGMTAVLASPLHRRLSKRLGNRRRLAAALTTLIVFLGFLLPSLGIGIMAVGETSGLLQSLDRDALAAKVATLQHRFSLGPPPAEVMQALDRMRRTTEVLENLPNVPEPRVEIESLLAQLQVDSELVEKRLALVDAGAPPAVPTATPTGSTPPIVNAVAPSTELHAAWQIWRQQLAEVKPKIDDSESWSATLSKARAALDRFRSDLLGGPIAAWFKQNVNVDADQLQSILDRLRSFAGPAALGTTQFLANFFLQFTLGMIIMLIALYYFLVDGRDMLESIAQLTPLDRKYSAELGNDFVNLTGAVVMSMLLAAGVQGLLAGIGYWLFGVPAIFLLTLLTTLFAMLPLVGATVIWGGAVVYLFLEGRTVAAIGLAAYGTFVISLADNIIKPMILHGRSNLHPLAGLLSVLGGAQALGPIGVFVGPMVVALLHTLLVMLRRELKIIELKPAAAE